jgi:hypothetical protein
MTDQNQDCSCHILCAFPRGSKRTNAARAPARPSARTQQTKETPWESSIFSLLFFSQNTPDGCQDMTRVCTSVANAIIGWAYSTRSSPSRYDWPDPIAIGKTIAKPKMTVSQDPESDLPRLGRGASGPDPVVPYNAHHCFYETPSWSRHLASPSGASPAMPFAKHHTRSTDRMRPDAPMLMLSRNRLCLQI